MCPGLDLVYCRYLWFPKKFCIHETSCWPPFQMWKERTDDSESDQIGRPSFNPICEESSTGMKLKSKSKQSIEWVLNWLTLFSISLTFFVCFPERKGDFDLKEKGGDGKTKSGRSHRWDVKIQHNMSERCAPPYWCPWIMKIYEYVMFWNSFNTKKEI